MRSGDIKQNGVPIIDLNHIGRVYGNPFLKGSRIAEGPKEKLKKLKVIATRTLTQDMSLVADCKLLALCLNNNNNLSRALNQ